MSADLIVQKTLTWHLGLMTAAFLALPVHAAAPIPFDSWVANVNTNRIDATCPSQFVCTDTIIENDFLQRTLTTLNGEVYIQQIIQENGFSNESFIRVNSNISGLANKQQLASIDGADNFSSSTQLELGWASDALNNEIQISQSLLSSHLGASYEDSFSFNRDLDQNGTEIGTFTDIRQRITDSSLITGTPVAGQDIQTFVFRRASGNQVPTAGSATLGGVMGGMGGMGGMGDGMMGGGQGGTINWNPGDDVQVVWVGQLCEGCQDGMMGGGMGGGGMGGGGMGGGGSISFSYQLFDNLVDALDPISTGSIVSTDPFTWPDPPFGVQPVL